METIFIKYRPFSINLVHDGNVYEGKVTPLNQAAKTGALPKEFHITLNGTFRGIFSQPGRGWESTSLEDKGLVDAVGNCILSWYEGLTDN